MAQSDELIRDIRQEIEKEKWIDFWHQYRIFLILGGIAIFLAIGMTFYWVTHTANLQEKSSATLLENLHLIDLAKSRNDPNAEIWKEIDSILSDTRTDQQALANLYYTLTLAEHHLHNGNHVAALALLEKIPTTNYLYFERLFTLWKGKAYVLAGQEEKALATLQELADSRMLDQHTDISIWSYIALEWLVELALRTGNIPLAQEHLKTLSDDSLTPQVIRERATLMLSILS